MEFSYTASLCTVLLKEKCIIFQAFRIVTKDDFIHSSNALKKSYLTSKFAFALLIASSRSVLLSKNVLFETKDAVCIIYQTNILQIIYIIKGMILLCEDCLRNKLLVHSAFTSDVTMGPAGHAEHG